MSGELGSVMRAAFAEVLEPLGFVAAGRLFRQQPSPDDLVLIWFQAHRRASTPSGFFVNMELYNRAFCAGYGWDWPEQQTGLPRATALWSSRLYDGARKGEPDSDYWDAATADPGHFGRELKSGAMSLLALSKPGALVEWLSSEDPGSYPETLGAGPVSAVLEVLQGR